MKVALVHDWLNQRGGAESVLEALVALQPDAPIYTSMFAPEAMPELYGRWDIRTTWMEHLPGIHQHHQQYLPLYPVAFGRLDLRDYDLVISNKSGFCHGVRTGPQTRHVCYCLTPTRFLWNYDEYVRRENIGSATSIALRPLIMLLRKWDRRAAQKVNHFIAISTEIQERIKRFYKRDATIIYPPVDTQRFEPSTKVEDYCLVVSRLVPYKRIDLAIEACSKLGLRLLVVGDGRDRARLEEMAGPEVEFLGRVPDSALPALMAHCRVFIFPGLEDFGIAPVEAQAAGRPVVAYRGGGALDTVIEGKTGILFDQQTTDSLCAALTALPDIGWDTATIRANAERFDVTHFMHNLNHFLDYNLNAKS